MKKIYVFVFALLSVNVVIAATPPTPVLYNFENPSVNQLTFNNAQIATTTPVFRVGTPAGTTNPNLIYIEINTTAAFTGTDWTQTFSGSFVNGTPNDFTFTNGFSPTNGVTYYVRAQASADGGSTYSSFSSGTFSFTYQTSGNTDWYQTTQAQFLTDSLLGLTATASSGVQLTSTSAGGNVFTDGSFENGGVNWYIDGFDLYNTLNGNPIEQIATGNAGVTNGTQDVQLEEIDGFSGNAAGGDFALVQQTVNLTGVTNLSFTWAYNNVEENTFDCDPGGIHEPPTVSLYVIISNSSSGADLFYGGGQDIPGTTVYQSSVLAAGCPGSEGVSSGGPFTVNVPISGWGANCTVSFVNYMNGYPNGYFTGSAFSMYIDNVQGGSAPSGTITSTSIDLASLKGATGWSTLQWNQTLNGGTVTLAVQKCINGTWTTEITGITSATDGANSYNISSIPFTTSYDSIRVVATIATTAGGTSPSLNSWKVTETVPSCTTPATPIVSATNNCGNSVLSTTATGGSLLWSTGATTSSITVTNSNTYSVTITVTGGCSATGSGSGLPLTIPSAPIVSVTNNCGNSILSTTSTGTLSWSPGGAITSSITVTTSGTYSVTQTVGGCTSPAGTGTAAPKTIPVAPTVSVVNNCGNSVLSTTSTGTLLWSPGQATTSSITITASGTYSVTQTVGGCTSAAGTNTAAPLSVPSAPIVSVVNNCGSSVLSTTATGALSWSSEQATTSSITVTASGTYSVTQTVRECTSPAGTGTAAPKAIPAAPTVSVVNNCGNSVLSTTATGALSWNTGATTSSITVTVAGTYSVTQTVNTCSSAAGTGTAAPSTLAAPVVMVVNNCGNSVLSTTATGTLSWSTGATASSITVTTAGTYSVTETVDACSSTGTGTAAPSSLPAPVVTVVNNCGNSVLSTTATGALLWNTGATTSSITVTIVASYSVTQTAEGCTSDAGTGVAQPTSLPLPIVSTANYCGYAVLSTPANGGTLLWSTGATTTSITVTDMNTYSVTITESAGCSATGTGSGAPYPIPPAPTVTVTNDCGYSTLSISTTDIAGSLILWSTGATTSSITVTTAGTYSVTYTLEVCTSAIGTGTAAPSSLAAPVVTVINNCGNSVLSTTATGALSWSTGETTSSITVTMAGTYSVTETVDACTSTGTGTAAPSSLAAPVVTVINNCGNSVLSTAATGALSWSTGETTSSITVTTAGTYSVTETVDACTSTGTGTAAPSSLAAPVVTVINNCGNSVLSTTATGALSWSTGAITSSITVTTAGTYTVTETVAACSNAGTGTAAPITIPAAPTVSVVNNCGNSVLSTTATGALLWNTGATTSSITVTMVAIYSVTQTAEGCTSDAGTGVAEPTSLPPPIVLAADYCGYAVLSTPANGGTLLWSTGATTTSITVTDMNTYSVTLTESAGCSATGTGSGAPYPIPPAPAVTVTNTCGYSTLSISTTDIAGSLILWSTGATTSSITVTTAGTYSVTYTLEVCASAVGTGTAAPSSLATPVVTVINNCGNSVLSTTATGALSWSTGETTSSITVTTAGTYSVTETVGACTGTGTGTAAPSSPLTAPVVTVVNNCGNSVLSTTATGALSWSTGATTSSITVTTAGTYSVTQTVNACISPSGTGTAAPLTIPAPGVTVMNNCGNAVLTAAGFTGSLLWSTSETTTSITVTTAGTYSVTQTVNGCTSPSGTGTAVPLIIAAPGVTVMNNCDSSVLTATGFTGSLLWSTSETTTSITVTAAGTYSVTQTVNGCTSPSGTGTAAPIVSCGGEGKNLYPGYACGDFNNGHGRILTSICYQVKKGDLVSNVQPGVFSYFAKVVAPSASFCVDVIQTKSCSNSLTFFEVDHNEQTFILDANCGRIDHNSATITSSPTEQTVGICIDNAIVNKTYIIAVKYDAKSIEGSIQGGDCIYTFSSRIVGGSTIPNSTSTLDAIQGCHGSRTADPTDNSSVDGITLTAYPNPFSDKATILLVSDIDYNNVTVELYNLMGQKTREIYYGPVKGNESAQIEIDGSEMESGIYIYRVIAGEESYYGRIILQKN